MVSAMYDKPLKKILATKRSLIGISIVLMFGTAVGLKLYVNLGDQDYGLISFICIAYVCDVLRCEITLL
jgi:hypothetical protein